VLNQAPFPSPITCVPLSELREPGIGGFLRSH
jgi:hypothetical protein